jgi:hypothetical protein
MSGGTGSHARADAPGLATGLIAQGATLVGREHARVGRNNQDGFAVHAAPGRTVGVVTDGCGSQPGSEVGAQLGARFLAQWLARARLCDELPEQATDALCGWLRTTASGFEGEPLEEVLDAWFLFTFLAVVREGSRATVFGLGDGALCADSEVVRLDPGPANAPEYCAYRLGRGRRPAPRLHFQGEARRVALMTDGFDQLLAREPARVVALLDGLQGPCNPRTLQRRLNVLGEAERLADDATLVVIGG